MLGEMGEKVTLHSPDRRVEQVGPGSRLVSSSSAALMRELVLGRLHESHAECYPACHTQHHAAWGACAEPQGGPREPRAGIDSTDKGAMGELQAWGVGVGGVKLSTPAILGVSLTLTVRAIPVTIVPVGVGALPVLVACELPVPLSVPVPVPGLLIPAPLLFKSLWRRACAGAQDLGPAEAGKGMGSIL